MATTLKSFSSLLLVLLCSSILNSQDADFRKVRWGMSKKEVKSLETASICANGHNLRLEGDCLCYDEMLAGDAYILSYCFLENKLESAAYARSDNNSNVSIFIDNFYGLKKVLEDKYGNAYTIEKSEGAGWGDYTMLVKSTKDLAELFKKDEFNVRLIWQKDLRTKVILYLQTIRVGNETNNILSVRYEPFTKNLLYDESAFDKEDLDKL